MTTTEQPVKSLEEQIREIYAEAARAGERPPGRPTLVRTTGASEHQVRQALEKLGTSTRQESGAELPPPWAGEQLETLVRQPASLEHQSPPTALQGTPSAGSTPRPWPLVLIAIAAAIAVWGGWVELGRLTGFGLVQPLPGLADGVWINTAIVLPIGIEAYGGYALRTWLSSADLSTRTRGFARWSAIASLVIGAGAQVASHLMRSAGVTTAPVMVTVLVSCVPVLVLGLATGLATLVRRDSKGQG
jgi:hypothetical protein